MKRRLAIIGTGISGLSCATELRKSGFNVTLFEKSKGVSGRLSTRVTEHWQCDHGAQYFTARDPHFNAEVQRWIKADVVKLWQPRLMEANGTDICAKEGETLRYVGYPGNSSPAKWLAKSMDIYFEHTVIDIQKDSEQWKITTKEHGAHPEQFDFVILAIPAPQAATLIKNQSEMLYELASNVKMLPCYALMINVKKYVDFGFDGLFINSGLLSWIARDSAKPGRIISEKKINHTEGHETWVLHANSKWSESHINDSKETISQEMIAEFIKLVRIKVPSFSIELDDYALHRWLYAECEKYQTCGFKLDIKNQVGLCGDWLNGGKVQGAWLSGYLLAKQLGMTTR